MKAKLNVLLAGRHVGIIEQLNNGGLSFTYDQGYAGIPLSLSMPLSKKSYGDKTVRPFIQGLLPDSADVRRALGAKFGVLGRNPFELLSIIGIDCPGAVQICSDESMDSILEQDCKLVPIDEEMIASRLRGEGNHGSNSWLVDHERWSLGGAQSKFALRKEGKKWFSCEGGVATTHIIKPSAHGLRNEAFNECFCLQLAQRCGIPASKASYTDFAGEKAIVIERFDRVRNKDGQVVRLHQEDFCQALSVAPDMKYTEDGGPGVNRVISVLKQTGDAARINIALFLKMLYFNYLIGAPDAHAKNYSLLIGHNGAYLAPLYDVATMIPYADRPFDIKLAMGIAGENRVCRLSSRRLVRFVETNALADYDIDAQEQIEELAFLAQSIPGMACDIASEYAKQAELTEFFERTLPVLEEMCKRSMARLG